MLVPNTAVIGKDQVLIAQSNLVYPYGSHVGYQYLYPVHILFISIFASVKNLASVENQRLLLHLQDLSLQHITNILWTYASFLHDVPDMLPAFTSQILERSHKEQFNAQQLSNLLWSLCILQVCPLWPWLICKRPWALGVCPWIVCTLPLD